MDSDAAPARRAGGTVEPVRRATVAKAFFQDPEDRPTKTYELRDPFAEVTYRAADRASIEAKANELGATRFHERDDAGHRTAINRVNGRWERETSPAPSRARTPEPSPPSTAPERATATRGDASTSHSTSTRARTDPQPAAEKVVPITGNTQARTTEPDAAQQAQQQSTGPKAETPSADRLRRVEAEAARIARSEQLESALHERYVIKRPPLVARAAGLGQTEYRFRGDVTRVAFTESMLKLSTDNNNPSVARSMVDVAETRKWGALRVSGNDEFKRMVWLEASVRGIKTVGYQPMRADLELLKKETESRRHNRIEPAPASTARPSEPAHAQPSASTATGAPAAAAGAAKQSTRGGGGRKAVLAALEAVLVDRKVPEKRREAVMAAAAVQLAQRTKAGEVHRVKIFDKDAPSQRMMPSQQPKVARQRERTGPAR